MKNRHNIIYTLCFYISSFVYLHNEWKLIKYACVIYLLFFILSRKVLLLREYRRLNVILCVFSLVVIISGVLSDMKYGHFVWHVDVTSSILLTTQVIVLFGYVEYIISHGLQRLFVRQFMNILGICLIIADFGIFYNLNNIIDSTEVNYVVGNKFALSYSHILFCAILFSYRQFSQLISVALISYCAIISKLVYCTTGLIGAVVFIILVLGRNTFGRLLYKRIFLYLCMLGSVFFALFISVIQNMEWYNNFLSLIGESSSINGRSTIYAQLVDIINGDPFWGYGNGNQQNYVEYYTGIGNAQNGILSNIINWGFIGTFMFMMIPWFIFGMCKNRHSNYFLLCLLYMFIIVATVEVTMSLWFLSALSLFLLMSNYLKNTILKV